MSFKGQMSDLICHLLVNVKKTSKTRVLQITIRGVGSNQKNSKLYLILEKNNKKKNKMKKLKYFLKTSQKCGKATKLINI